MITPSSEMLDETLAAIADPTRRAILARLAQGRARVTEIAEPFEMSLNAVSKHIQVLEGAGLVKRQVSGREHWLSFHGAPLVEAASWINYYQRFWDEGLQNLDRMLRRRRNKKADALK